MSSAPLVRLLGDAAALDLPPPRQDMAERLSQWLSAVDAVKVHGALQSIQALGQEPPPPPPLRPVLPAHLVADVQKVRAALVADIMGTTGMKASRAAPPQRLSSTPPPPVDEDAEPDYAAYLKRYLEQQRRMEAAIGPLRTRVRQALAKGAQPLRQLAALDALMEQTLGGREQKLLSTVPLFLERRFEQRRQQQQQPPTQWRQPGGWLHGFGQEWQAALLAELDLRLQPVLGLMDAFNNEISKQP